MEPEYSVIGGRAPRLGFAAPASSMRIAELFKAGILDGKGKFVRQGKRIQTDEYNGICRYILVSARGKAASDTPST
jgi:hypothetical protein